MSLGPARAHPEPGDRPLTPIAAETPEQAQDRYRLEGASFSVAGRTLLEPLTLDLEPGRMIGLVGHNGSGKSTLVKLLARQQPATGGVVRFGGAPLARWSARAFARKVAYLPQTPAPATGLTVGELVALGRYPWHGALGRFSEADSEAVGAAIALTELGGFSDRMVEEMSGGERQRVWIAMLLAQQATWLLLDEPTSALDIAHQVEVLALLRRLSATRGVGVIVVLHDVNMAARYCDEIVALRRGRMIARAAPADLMEERRLEEIFGVPMAVLPPVSGAPVAIVR